VAVFLQQVDRAVLGLAAVLLLAAAATVALARWRLRRETPPRRAWTRSLAEVAMVAGTMPWLVMALWPIDLPPGAVRWRLLPFTDAAAQLSGPPGEAFAQIIGNLLVFSAIGLFGPVRFHPLTGGARLFALGATASLALEICQQAFGTGRVFSVDDVLLNGLGCLLGGLVSRPWWTGQGTTRTPRGEAGAPAP
jgi:hypothetical protein